MHKLKINLFRLIFVAAVLSGALEVGYAQIKITISKEDSSEWLRNNRAAPNDWTVISDYYEDSYYGIEKIEKRVLHDGSELDDPYRARQGTGAAVGSGIGSGGSEDRAPAASRWIPYYERPSNCATSDYRPEINQNLLRIDAAIKKCGARIVYQPRPLYSKADYLAGREGTIKLQVRLKADGTVGAVRPLSRLPGNLTQSAVRSACYLTFYPAVVNGRAADSAKIIAYTFKPEQVHQDEATKYPPPPPGTATLKIIAKPRPEYTPEARQNQLQGTVTLRVTFLASGEIGAVVPIVKLADGLTEKAVEAAHRIRFEPARENGRTVTQTKSVQYNFTLY